MSIVSRKDYDGVIISGDSWGCGEWLKDLEATVIHLGLEEYFKSLAGLPVINTSKGGLDINEIRYNLFHTLNTCQFDNPFVIIFSTDFFRGIRNWREHAKLTPYEYDKVNTERKSLWLNELDKICKDHNVQGHLLGCLGILTESDINECSNLDLIIGNVIHFLDPQRESTKQYRFYVRDINWRGIGHFFQQYRNIDLFNYLHRQNRIWLDIVSDTAKYPDGAHPNRKCHLQLYNYIIENYF